MGAALGTSTSKHTLEFAGSFPSGTRIPEARNDVRVRRAISMANDRQKQVDTVYEGHGVPGWGVPYIYYQDTMPTAAQLGPWWQDRPAEAKKAPRGGGPPERVRNDALLL